MAVERLDLGSEGDRGCSAKSAVPTETELVHAIEEWEEGAAYRKVRHAASVGGCYSTATICLAHDAFGNQRLTDDLVRNRLEHAEFSKAELDPLAPGSRASLST